MLLCHLQRKMISLERYLIEIEQAAIYLYFEQSMKTGGKSFCASIINRRIKGE